MTNLPAPEGYRNRGKGVSRHLTEPERRTIAEYASKHGNTRAAEKFCVDRQTARKYVREFGLPPHPSPKNEYAYARKAR